MSRFSAGQAPRRSRRSGRKQDAALTILVGLTIGLIGVLGPVGVSTTGASVLRHPLVARSLPSIGASLAGSTPQAVEAHGASPLNLAYTETFTHFATVPQVATGTPQQPQLDVGRNMLSVDWGSGSLILNPSTPIVAGGTYDLSNANGFGASTAGFECTSDTLGDAAVDVTIDQLVLDSSDKVLSMALQFDCALNTGSGEIDGTVAYNAVPSTPGQGYYLYGDDGSLGGFGNDEFLNYLGDLTTTTLNAPVVGMSTTPSGGGYWMVAGDGGVFSFGDAGFYGSTGNLRLNKPVLGMASTPDGRGYWFVASDGGIFSFGDAGFYGSTGNIHLNRPIVGMASTPDGHGYWLVASDGGIFAFGDAGFYGSTGNIDLNQPIVGMSPTPDGHGYWLVAADGGIFSFGDAKFYGSTGNIHLNSPIVGMTSSPDGKGYWFTASDGGVFAFGDAAFAGSLGGLGIDNVVGMSR
jgi:ribosomal protein L24E